MPRSKEVTGLLKAWSSGDQTALERLASVVYKELHRMARRYMKNERPGNTLQTTALVNEVYLRLVDIKNVDWQHRAQFFAISAQMMRRILVDAARARAGPESAAVVQSKSMLTKRPCCLRNRTPRFWPWMRRWRRSRGLHRARPGSSSYVILPD